MYQCRYTCYYVEAKLFQSSVASTTRVLAQANRGQYTLQQSWATELVDYY